MSTTYALFVASLFHSFLVYIFLWLYVVHPRPHTYPCGLWCYTLQVVTTPQTTCLHVWWLKPPPRPTIFGLWGFLYVDRSYGMTPKRTDRPWRGLNTGGGTLIPFKNRHSATGLVRVVFFELGLHWVGIGLTLGLFCAILIL